MITPQNYLDLGNIIFNELFGSVILALFVGITVIAYLSLQHRAPIEVTITLIIAFCLMVIGYAYDVLLLALIVLFIGVLGYVSMSKVVKRS